MLSRVLSRVLCLATAVGLSACGGGSDPMEVFTKQSLVWQTCEPTILGSDASGAFARLGSRLQCADMRVPLNYDNPAEGEATVALLRVSAEDSQRRTGSIFFNPGGPGQDGLALAVQFGLLWKDANPDHPLGKPLKQLSTSYDLVGFSPRGVGASTRLYCASSELTKETRSLVLDGSDQNIQNMLYNARVKADACRSNPLTRHINTEQTVRDLDLARSLLGDEKLNYIGYSYGTWLGAWYASRFPQRVGRLVLDSNMDFAGTFDDARLNWNRGMQRILDEVIAPYAARHDDKFKLGTTADEVRAIHGALPDSLKEFLRNLPLSHRRNLGTSVAMLVGAKGVANLLETFPMADPNVFYQLVEQRKFSDDAEFDGMARAQARNMIAHHFRPPFQRAIVVMEPSAAVYEAVVCNDMPSRTDPQYWIEQGKFQAANYPVFGGSVADQPCVYWGGPAVVKPPLSAASAAPILMVQSEYDGPTPREGALTAFKALPNAGMIYVTGEYSHGVFPYETSCVDQAVADYFVNGSFPGTGQTLTCTGKPLPFDPEPAVFRKAGKPEEGGQPYLNPAQARELIDGIHRTIQQGGLRF